ncbi:MAG: AAA family ATPase [Acidimicrobiales bacterium]
MPKAQLLEVYAHGLGVIEEARLELGAGFNVITGETGAGKTLLLGALDLCLGAEAPSSRYAVLSDMRTAAVFDVGDGQEVVLGREASSSGRLRSTINGAPSSAETLRNYAEQLIVIHGQHDSLALRNRSEVLRILDASAGISTEELEEVRRRLNDALRLRAGFGGDAQRRERELEFVRFQIEELEAAKITSTQELHESLETLTRLTSLQQGQAAVGEVLQELDADDDDAVLVRFARVIAKLPPGDVCDSARTSLKAALEQAREGVHELTVLFDGEAFDQAAADKLEARVGVLRQIARKYGGSLDSAVDALEQLRNELKLASDQENRLLTLDDEIATLRIEERELARVARREREFAAVRLGEAVRRQLPRVALGSATLRFEVAGEDGSEVQILFSANPGFPEGPLQTLASGGELSRVLLALSLETAHEDVVAVFDEIDAGVGGQVAQQIGQCLAELGRQQQVLAVTHLASVAAKADHHFVIEKSSSSGATLTTLRHVTGSSRVEEIARMLAGDEMSNEAKALAAQLLETSP